VVLDRGARVQAGVILALLAFVLLVLPSMLSSYWTDVATSVVIYSVVALGLGMLMGRVGLVSLGQIAILAMGAWIAARLTYATSLPYPLVLLASGAMTAVLGTLVGLPALRLSGLFLALITLMLAGAITVVLTTTQFPNGGPGFLGHTDSSLGSNAVRRPAIATGDAAYFRYAVVVAVLMFGAVLLHLRSKAGRAWAAIRQSEASALAAGVDVTRYKLWALALASFITGIAGGLLAGSVG
jgi:branched-chain amino acid transport system permease protein